MKKRILILGAGNAQIDAIEYCRAKGYEVCGVSYTNTDKGIPMLDHFRQVDIKDVEGVAAYAKEMGVSAVYSVGSDLAIPTVMAVSEKLGLPHFLSPQVAAVCQAKHRMREALGPDFPGNAPYIVAASLEEALGYTAFPGMLKPVDSQGQRGCFRVDSPEDIKAHFAASLDYSKEGKVIIEKFITGPEISVNAYLQGGVLKFALVSDRLVFDEFPGGIIKEHRIPTTFADAKAEAETVDLVGRVCARLGITDGPCYFQIKLDEDNHPVLLEVAPRLDGCHMWNLIRHYCGADLLDAAFSQLLEGASVMDEAVNFDGTEMKLIFMCEAPGAAYDRSRYDVSKADYVCWYYQDGDVVRRLNGFMEKGGYRIEKTGRCVR